MHCPYTNLYVRFQTSSKPTFSAKQDLLDTLNPNSLPRSSSSDLLNQPNRFTSREVLDLPRSSSRDVLDLPRSLSRDVLNLPRSSSRDGLDLPRQPPSSNRNMVNLPRSRDQSNYLPARQSQADLLAAQRAGSVDLLSRSSDDLLLDLPPRPPPVPAPRRLEQDRLRVSQSRIYYGVNGRFRDHGSTLMARNTYNPQSKLLMIQEELDCIKGYRPERTLKFLNKPQQFNFNTCISHIGK